MINGILTIILIGFIVVIILRTLEIENNILSIILAGLMVSFPVVASLFIYIFTAPAYFLSILLNVFAIYMFSKNKNIVNFIISVLLITFSLGIYQDFLGISAALAILVLIKDIVNSDKTAKNIIIDGLKYLLILTLSLVLYFIIHKISLNLTNVQMSGHNGLNNIGKIEILKIPNQIIKAYRTFFLFDWFYINGNLIDRIIIVSSFVLTMLITVRVLLNKKFELAKKALFYWLLYYFLLQ